LSNRAYDKARVCSLVLNTDKFFSCTRAADKSFIIFCSTVYLSFYSMSYYYFCNLCLLYVLPYSVINEW